MNIERFELSPFTTAAWMQRLRPLGHMFTINQALQTDK